MKRQYQGVVIVFILASLLSINFAHAQTVKTPTIEAIDKSSEFCSQPLLTGLTSPNSEVLVYLNEEFVGLASVNETETNTDNYYWRPSFRLTPGDHSIAVVARDKTSLTQSLFSLAKQISINPLPAPTLVVPDKDTVTGKVKPIIKGLTVNHTKVHIFIDGILNGSSDVLSHESGTANFAHTPFLNLSIGEHTAWAISEDQFGNKSTESNILNFTIEAPLPAPIIFSPVINSSTTREQPFIVGLVKNDTKISVFIDHQLNGEFSVENHESGTASFAYKPFAFLSPGPHLVYTVASDDRGKESQWSNVVYFQTGPIKEPTISDSAVEDVSVLGEEGIFSSSLKNLVVLAKLFASQEEVELTDEQTTALAEFLERGQRLNVSDEEFVQLKDLYEAKQETVSQDTGEKSLEELAELEEILAIKIGTSTENTGLINESEEKQGKLKLNLVIFILFLVAVIVWIFWVNRELIKERREQDEGDSKTDTKEDQDSFKL